MSVGYRQPNLSRELARIKAVQKHYEYTTHGRPFRSQPANYLKFKEWLQNCINHYQSQGAKFERTDEGILIIWGGRKPVYRSFKDLEEEYNTDYLSQIDNIN